MKVGELIEQLKGFDPELPAMLYSDNYCSYWTPCGAWPASFVPLADKGGGLRVARLDDEDATAGILIGDAGDLPDKN